MLTPRRTRLLARRMGANELRTIDVIRGYVAAQVEYASAGHDEANSRAGMYARVLRSDPGRQNGLYWQARPVSAPSPAGPFLAAAAAEGYKASAAANGPAPYHGYVYRHVVLAGACGGGWRTRVRRDRKLTGGFALLAYPAEYGETGIQTFMVNQDGLVWQRDLGEKTAEVAAAITRFNPDSSWTPIPSNGDGAMSPMDLSCPGST